MHESISTPKELCTDPTEVAVPGSQLLTVQLGMLVILKM